MKIILVECKTGEEKMPNNTSPRKDGGPGIGGKAGKDRFRIDDS